MSMLTDSQQMKLLEELSQTTTRFRAAAKEVLKEYGIDKIPAEIEQLRAENKQLHAQTCGKISLFKKKIRNGFSSLVGELDKQPDL